MLDFGKTYYKNVIENVTYYKLHKIAKGAVCVLHQMTNVIWISWLCLGAEIMKDKLEPENDIPSIKSGEQICKHPRWYAREVILIIVPKVQKICLTAVEHLKRDYKID